jgi:hypothetical protein
VRSPGNLKLRHRPRVPCCLGRLRRGVATVTNEPTQLCFVWLLAGRREQREVLQAEQAGQPGEEISQVGERIFEAAMARGDPGERPTSVGWNQYVG